MQIWFAAAELAILTRSLSDLHRHVFVVDLVTLLGVHGNAARRVKKIVLLDLAPGGPGLLREAVCVERAEHVPQRPRIHYLNRHFRPV